MIVGVPKEVKDHEYRVAMVPSGVDALVKAGHKVLIEKGAGLGSGVSDADYKGAGAEIVATAKEVWDAAEMIVKVKEPQPSEYKSIKANQVVFTYFHFAAERELLDAMLERKATCVTYETLREKDGSLPLLIPMSEVAGRMSIQEGAKYLERPMEGRGVLLGGVPGVAPAEVVVIGAGTVGANAAKVAAGFGAHVTILDINMARLRYLDDVMPANVTTMASNAYNIREAVSKADLVIGSVLVPGARTPHLVTKDMVKLMKDRSVIVDVAIDQGGCVETSRPTTHTDPIFMVDNVVHYCVTNIPGAVAVTSTYALTNYTLPYALQLANKGYKKAAIENPAIATAINVVDGKITFKGVSDAFNLPYTPVSDILGE